MPTINETITAINSKADSTNVKVDALRTAIEAYIHANPQADVAGLQNALDKITAAETAVENIITEIPVI